MEKGSPGVSNKIGPLAYDELSQVLQEVKGVEQFLRFLQKLWKIGEIAVFAKINYKC